MSNNRKRPAPPPQKPSPAAQAPKHHAASQEDEFVDEDIFLDETLLLEDEEILRDLEDRRTLASRLSKWVRPPLSNAYISHSRSIREAPTLHFHALHFTLLGFRHFKIFVSGSLSFSAIGD